MEGSIEERTVRVQASMREQVAKMDAIWKQKVTEELTVRRQEQKLDRVLSAFKSHAKSRVLKVPGYGDTGRKWKALPEGMRKTIEDFNRLHKEGQTMALARMREDSRLTLEQMEKLLRLKPKQVQEMELGRGRGREG